MNHTKEPWRTTDLDRVISDTMENLNDDYFIADCFGPDAKENARRIVACVNACQDFETEDLEENFNGVSMTIKYVLDGVCDELKKAEFDRELIKVQRDELLAALKAIYDRHNAETMAQARNVIAKCEAQS